MALSEDGRHVRVEADSEQHRGGAQGCSTDLAGCVGDGERMQVDHSVERIGTVLTVDPVTQGSEIVAEVQFAGGLDARQHAWLRQRFWNGGRGIVGHV